MITKEGIEKTLHEDVMKKLEVEVGDSDAKKTGTNEKVSVEEEKVVKEEGEVKYKECEKKENVKMEVELKTGVSYLVKLADGKEPNSPGL